MAGPALSRFGIYVAQQRDNGKHRRARKHRSFRDADVTVPGRKNTARLLCRRTNDCHQAGKNPVMIQTKSVLYLVDLPGRIVGNRQHRGDQQHDPSRTIPDTHHRTQRCRGGTACAACKVPRPYARRHRSPLCVSRSMRSSAKQESDYCHALARTAVFGWKGAAEIS